MLKNKRICYVVDDDADDQEIFQMAIDLIKESNFQVKMFSRASEFLSEISMNSTPPDYVFMDVNMPGMDGFECLANLRKLNVPKNFKLFMVSTSARSSDIERAKDLGVQSYIVKPFSIGEYSRILSEHIC